MSGRPWPWRLLERSQMLRRSGVEYRNPPNVILASYFA